MELGVAESGGSEGGILVAEHEGTGTRKRIKQKTKRSHQKAERKKRPNFNNKDCNHTKKIYRCNEVTSAEIECWRKKLYDDVRTKIEQDHQICRLLAVAPPERKRPRKNKISKHSVSVTYVIPSKNGHKTVCLQFLRSKFKLSQARIIRLSKILLNGDLPREKRGGDRISHKLKSCKDQVRDFLRSLRGVESHYGRNKSKRIYLQSNLNISKLYRIYAAERKETKNKVVSFSTFQRIFCGEFNIGFNSPASDICSLCERLKNSILREKDPKKKVLLQTEKRVHKLRANAFYQLLKEEVPESVTYCFDLQQVQVLPKTPVSDAFYLRQISYYNLGIVPANSKNPDFFTWMEDEAGRGSTEVSSALLSFLNSLELLPATKFLRLFCDGCGGQNKNSHLVHMLIYWLTKTTSGVTKIIVVFPVRGHSFLPADRAFGRAEKLLRKEPFIKKKEDYHNIYREVGNVKILERDWKLYDVKGLEKYFKKVSGISAMKRIIIEKTNKQNGSFSVLFRGLQNYRFESDYETPQNLCKRGTKLLDLNLPELKLGRQLPQAKIDNLKSLLKAEFNEDWENDVDLAWYKDLINKNAAQKNVDTEMEQTCTCLDEEETLHI